MIKKRNWLRICSPFAIASILIIIAIIESLFEMEKSGGWSMIGVIIGLPLLIVLVIIDLLIKTFKEIKTTVIWLLEIGLLIITLFVLFNWLGYNGG